MKFFSVILAAGLMTGLELQAASELENAIEVIVNVAPITRYEVFRNGIQPVLEQLSQQYRNDLPGFNRKLNEMATEARERMLEDQLILHEFETAGYALPESVIDDFVQQQIKSGYTDRATLTKTLQADGDTYERFRKRLRDRFIIRQMRLKNVSDAIIVSPHKIETYYGAHTNDFIIENRVKMRMIVLTNTVDDPTHARKLAEEIQAKLSEGASFSEMAKLYSHGAHSSEGGEWDWVTQGMLRKELDEVAFALKPGDRSGVIETPEACYLVLVEDKSPGHIRPLPEVREEIERRLVSEEQERLQKQWIARLKKKTFVRYFQDQPVGETR